MKKINREKFIEACLADKTTTMKMAKAYGKCVIAECTLDKIKEGVPTYKLAELESASEQYEETFKKSLSEMMRYLFALNKEVSFMGFVESSEYYEVYEDLMSLISCMDEYSEKTA